MIDLLGEAVRAAGSSSSSAYPLCFAAGLVTSVGPCVAPRYVAVAALANDTSRGWFRIVAFIAGLVGAYIALGLSAASLGGLWTSSPALYSLLATVLAVSGVATILGARGSCDSPRHNPPRPAHDAANSTSCLGGAFLLGAASALIVSPCCTPFVVAIAGLTMLSGRAATGATLLAAFAFGHAAPLICAGALGTRFTVLFARLANAQAPKVVAGSLMLALGCYYGALA